MGSTGLSEIVRTAVAWVASAPNEALSRVLDAAANATTTSVQIPGSGCTAATGATCRGVAALMMHWKPANTATSCDLSPAKVLAWAFVIGALLEPANEDGTQPRMPTPSMSAADIGKLLARCVTMLARGGQDALHAAVEAVSSREIGKGDNSRTFFAQWLCDSVRRAREASHVLTADSSDATDKQLAHDKMLSSDDDCLYPLVAPPPSLVLIHTLGEALAEPTMRPAAVLAIASRMSAAFDALLAKGGECNSSEHACTECPALSAETEVGRARCTRRLRTDAAAVAGNIDASLSLRLRPNNLFKHATVSQPTHTGAPCCPHTHLLSCKSLLA